MKVIGHRGSPYRAPENTEASFKVAISEGAFGIELDVRSSFDNIVYVHHDDSL